jgi:hypothetical protein
MDLQNWLHPWHQLIAKRNGANRLTKLFGKKTPVKGKQLKWNLCWSLNVSVAEARIAANENNYFEIGCRQRSLSI